MEHREKEGALRLLDEIGVSDDSDEDLVEESDHFSESEKSGNEHDELDAAETGGATR